MTSLTDAVYDQNRDFRGYGRNVPKVRWPDDARVAVSIVINYESGAEYSHASGDKRNEGIGEFGVPLNSGAASQRDLCMESIYEYGSRAGIWRLARLLDEYKLKSTFFATAVALELNPDVAGYIQEAGHEPCCHGWRWDEVWRFTRDEERERMQAAIASIEKTCGERPRGWLSRCTPSANTRELLVEEGGFIYDSDSYADDLPYFKNVNGKQHLIVPYSLVYNDVRFVLSPGFSDANSFFTYCQQAFDYLWDEGKTHPRMMSIGLHPRWVGQAGRAGAVKAFIEHALGKGEVWFARRVDIAEWWHAHHEEFDAD